MDDAGGGGAVMSMMSDERAIGWTKARRGAGGGALTGVNQELTQQHNRVQRRRVIKMQIVSIKFCCEYRQRGEGGGDGYV